MAENETPEQREARQAVERAETRSREADNQEARDIRNRTVR